MNIFLYTILLCFIVATTGDTQAKGSVKKDFGIIYGMKRLFGPSSAKSLAKMSQSEKDEQLLFYAQQECQKPSFLKGICTGPVFKPLNKHFNEIVYLIEHGASVNLDIPYYWWAKIGGRGSFKPVYLFIMANDLERTRILLEHGATVDKVLQTQDALTFAQTVEMADLLMKYGACINFSQKEEDGIGITNPLFAFYALHEAVAQPEYEPGLIPFYLSHYEGDKNAFAQAVWKALQKAKWSYKYNPMLMQQFHQKKQYLKDAGIEIDSQWNDDAYVWSSR